jgi:hypothetical protein
VIRRRDSVNTATRRLASVISVGAGAVLLVFSVGFYRSHTHDDGWLLLRSLGRTLTVEITTSACAWVHSPSVVESATAVEVDIRWTEQPLPCSAQAIVHAVDVTLERPLGDRTLLGCEGPGARRARAVRGSVTTDV